MVCTYAPYGGMALRKERRTVNIFPMSHLLVNVLPNTFPVSHLLVNVFSRFPRSFTGSPPWFVLLR